MSVPIQVSIPLALYLRRPVYGDLAEEEHGGYQKNLEDILFNTYPGRLQATLLFASILRPIFEHPDWSQLHAFFTKRYSKSQMLSDRQARKLIPAEDPGHDRSVWPKQTSA